MATSFFEEEYLFSTFKDAKHAVDRIHEDIVKVHDGVKLKNEALKKGSYTMNYSWTNLHASTIKVMKKVLSYICLIILLGCAMFHVSEASAASEADQYLMDGRWEMHVTNWAPVKYMNFYSDGIGIMEVPYGDSYYNYSFTWYTYSLGIGPSDTYIGISFEGAYHKQNGWGVNDVPYQVNTYRLVWNDRLMFLIDMPHLGTNMEKSMKMEKEGTVNPYL